MHMRRRVRVTARMRECCHFRPCVSQGFPPSVPLTRHPFLLACFKSTPAYARTCPRTHNDLYTHLHNTGNKKETERFFPPRGDTCFGTAACREQTATAPGVSCPVLPQTAHRPDITQGSASQGPRHSPFPFPSPAPVSQGSPLAHNVNRPKTHSQTRRCPSASTLTCTFTPSVSLGDTTRI